ncbi:MAG: hypothetical protein D6785_15640 [Planctomycetota bacterium]|nr:MAG: hypothetical protein D6785_15640 [Planctomycetota bacterium]
MNIQDFQLFRQNCLNQLEYLLFELQEGEKKLKFNQEKWKRSLELLIKWGKNQEWEEFVSFFQNILDLLLDKDSFFSSLAKNELDYLKKGILKWKEILYYLHSSEDLAHAINQEHPYFEEWKAGWQAIWENKHLLFSPEEDSSSSKNNEEPSLEVLSLEKKKKNNGNPPSPLYQPAWEILWAKWNWSRQETKDDLEKRYFKDLEKILLPHSQSYGNFWILHHFQGWIFGLSEKNLAKVSLWKKAAAEEGQRKKPFLLFDEWLQIAKEKPHPKEMDGGNLFYQNLLTLNFVCQAQEEKNVKENSKSTQILFSGRVEGKQKLFVRPLPSRLQIPLLTGYSYLPKKGIVWILEPHK